MGLGTFCMTGVDVGLSWMALRTVGVASPDKPPETTVTLFYGFYGMMYAFWQQ